VPVVAGSSPGPRFVLADAGFYYTEPTPQAIARALRLVHEARIDATLDSKLRQGIERARAEFSVEAVARRLDSLLRDGGPPPQ
jgi:glycosyltransferase involved in cell wall biosynthesis